MKSITGSRWAYVFLVIILVGASCDLPTVLSDILIGTKIPPTPTRPTCLPESLRAPLLSNPVNWRIEDDPSPTLTWTYPDPSCAPQGYIVDLSTGPLFTDDRGGSTGSPLTSWVPAEPLELGKEYRWSVRPINGTIVGPASEERVFYTGPICDTAGLVAPTLLDPADGASIASGTPTLVWDYPQDCTPQSYNVDLSTDPEFQADNLGGEAGYPSERWVLTSPLTDCRKYYWRVAPVNITTAGPYSQVNTFMVDFFGQCSSTFTGQGAISGLVWNDVCEVPPGTLPLPLPQGCVEHGSSGARANATLDSGEKGISGIQVDLGSGECPSTGLTNTVTGIDGQYTLPHLAGGTYCVSVDSSKSPNNAVFTSGLWTAPGEVSGPLAGITVVLGDAQTLADVNFGWDFQLVPTPGMPTLTPIPSATPIPPPTLTTTQNANCRYGPGTVYDVLTSVRSGRSFPIEGRNEDSTWWYVRIPGDYHCWISAATGTTEGDVNNVTVITSPPTPTPKPDNSGPSIENLTVSADPVYFPLGCGANNLTISAKITDDSGVASANVIYRYVTGGGIKGNSHTAEMSLSGGVYAVTIDVGSEAQEVLGGSDGTLEFQINAKDALGQLSTAPNLSLKVVVVKKC
jgi:hypothetical protein